MMNIQTNWDGGGEWRERGVTWLVVWMLLWTQPPRWRCAMICSLIGQIIHVEKTKTNTPRWRCAIIFNFWNSPYFSSIWASLDGTQYVVLVLDTKKQFHFNFFSIVFGIWHLPNSNCCFYTIRMTCEVVWKKEPGGLWHNLKMRDVTTLMAGEAWGSNFGQFSANFGNFRQSLKSRFLWGAFPYQSGLSRRTGRGRLIGLI